MAIILFLFGPMVVRVVGALSSTTTLKCRQNVYTHSSVTKTHCVITLSISNGVSIDQNGMRFVMLACSVVLISLMKKFM